MQTIVIDAREWSTTTGRYIRGLVESLQQIDNEHEYVILLKPQDFAEWKPSNKNFRKVITTYKEFSFGEQIGFMWQLLELHPDLVHFPMVQQPILYHGKVVTTMQDLTTLRFTNPSKNTLVFKIKQRVYHWVNMVAVRKSAHLITPTEFVKDDVAKHLRVNSRKITVTLEAGDSIAAKPEIMKEFLDKKFIMYVGRPLPHKNLERLIDAFALLKQTHPELHLVLVGKTDVLFRRHEKETSAKGIPDVHFTGFMSDGQLRWLYEHCTAYVFPSLSEGFGLPGLEAMAHGAPVVSSNATCLPEVYGDAAHYFNPLDIDAMAKAIADILEKPDLKYKLIAAGRDQFRKYSWERMAKQTLDVYKKTLSED